MNTGNTGDGTDPKENTGCEISGFVTAVGQKDEPSWAFELTSIFDIATELGFRPCSNSSDVPAPNEDER